MTLLEKAFHWVDCVSCYYEVYLKEKKIFLQKSIIVVPSGECRYFKENIDMSHLVEKILPHLNSGIKLEFSDKIPSDTLYYEYERKSVNQIVDYIEVPTLANWMQREMYNFSKNNSINVLRNYENISNINYDLTNLEILTLAKALR